MTIAFLFAGAAVLVQIHAIQQAAPIVYQAQQEDIQVLPADHPITKALTEAQKKAAASNDLIKVHWQCGDEDIISSLSPGEGCTPHGDAILPPNQPTTPPAPVLPPILIVVPPAPVTPQTEAPAPVPAPVPVATTSPKVQSAYMPKAPEVKLTVNGEEVESITVKAGTKVTFAWVVSGESSQIESVLEDEEGSIRETALADEGSDEQKISSATTFTLQAVGKSSGFGTKKVISVSIQ